MSQRAQRAGSAEPEPAIVGVAQGEFDRDPSRLPPLARSAAGRMISVMSVSHIAGCEALEEGLRLRIHRYHLLAGLSDSPNLIWVHWSRSGD